MKEKVEIKMNDPKESNPKQAIGTRKAPASCVSQAVMSEIALAMLDGACKYGRHNQRAAGVRASTYYDAARRHLDRWYEGEDLDPDMPEGARLSNITKAIAGLVVLRDGMLAGKFEDDRPPRLPGAFADHDRMAGVILDAYPEHKAAYTHAAQDPRIAISNALRASLFGFWDTHEVDDE